MLDIAYLAEANIEAAEILKERAIFSPPFWIVSDIVFCIQYWSIMYYTHGGI